MDKHSELRQRLKNVMIRQPISYKQLAQNIGINYRSLVDFVDSRRDTRILSLSMIEKYLMERERDDE